MNEKKCRLCQMCGTKLQPRRMQSVKNFGKIYYTKLCADCLKKQQKQSAGVMLNNINYDNFRKHWTRDCLVCGKVFDVKGHKQSGTIKTCSKECASALRSKLSTKRRSAELFLGPNRHKGWVKTFEAAQTKDAVRLGPTNKASLKVALMSPDGEVYDVCNVTHFVRTHGYLFNDSDIAWAPFEKSSRVDAVGKRPSCAVGKLRCRASVGLLCVARGSRRTWKGWRKAESAPTPAIKKNSL
jgi:hypothetical protein